MWGANALLPAGTIRISQGKGPAGFGSAKYKAGSCAVLLVQGLSLQEAVAVVKAARPQAHPYIDCWKVSTSIRMEQEQQSTPAESPALAWKLESPQEGACACLALWTAPKTHLPNATTPCALRLHLLPRRLCAAGWLPAALRR